MMLHNLYYIAFRKEDYKKLSVNASSIYKSTSATSGFIEVSASISASNVTHTARSNIKFVSGFSVSGGKSYKSNTLPRPNNYQGIAYKTISATDCVNSLKSASVDLIYDNNQENISEYTEPMQIEKQVTSNHVDLFFENSEISIFPNPSKGVITILPCNSLLPMNYEIVNFNGVFVYKGSIDSEMQQVDLSILPKGIYLIRFHAKDKIHNMKLSLIY